ncbi:MAG TPA: hypothetical protein PKA14_26305 [Leptospiraceae bacterium]|nr:hypothetical protein [Leptospiraceae bacterium]
MQVLSVILLMFFLGCETDPFRDQKRRSSKYKIAALIGHYTETKSVVQVDEQTYNAYKIGDSYSKGTVVNKYIDSRFFFFVISKIARDASQ